MMYIVSGANLHGQWLNSNPILNGFQNVSRNKYDSVDINKLKLMVINWAYNIFQDFKKVYLSGSWCGINGKFVELNLPKEIVKGPILVCGNDYNILLFEINLHIMWVISLEEYGNVKTINLKTEIPSRIKQIKDNDVIVKVCATNFYCIALTAEGTVYCGSLPGPLDLSGCIGRVCDVQCGHEHYLLLTDTGRVYSWGNGRRLQLGHCDLSNIETPKEIEALGGIKITKISAGGWHSLALSEFGDLYAWGWNETGQLGIKVTDNQINVQVDIEESILKSYDLPTLVDIFDENGDLVNTNVKHISCGNVHSAIMLEDNSVWTAGSNKYGQLGIPTETRKRQCFFKKTYQCCDTSFISCGPWVTVIASETEPIKA